MPSRSSLREYHLLVARCTTGFYWQIRFNKHAKPVQTSDTSFGLQAEAEQAGRLALEEFKIQLVIKD